MPRPTKKIEATLQKKGFLLLDNRDHNVFWLIINDKKTKINTKTSLGYHKEIDDSLLSKMRKQMCLNKNQFEDFMNCPMTKEKYIEILKSQGDIKL